ncbi:hypothetical protein DFH08DRAFT_815257 [Mycena albidolilacea]|uniref:Uncharacterized protein n=1 Tax=Mycena albidolilacea TaxID=1033008 RepID=A0AAD6ZNG1_9AGAR|nr:hypothetical protein DFH08DRAFT_815257 [Mycena albidolilacea]
MASPHNYPFGTSTIFNEQSTSDKEDNYSRKFFELLKTPESMRVQHLPDVNTSSEDSFLNCGGEWRAPDFDDLLGGPLPSPDWGDEPVYFDSRMKENKVLELVPNPPNPRSRSSVPHVVANVTTTENESSHVPNTRSQSPTVPPVALVVPPVSEPDLSKEDDEDCEKEIMGMGAKYEFPPLPLPLPPRNTNLRTAQCVPSSLSSSSAAPWPYHAGYFDVRATSPAPSFLSAPSPSSSSAALSPYSAASPAASIISALSTVALRVRIYADAEDEDASERENDAPIDASPQPRVILRLPARHKPTYASMSRPTISSSPANLFPSPTGTSESDHGDDEEHMPSEGELRSKDTEDADADYAPAPKRIRTNSGKAVPRSKGKAKRKAKGKAKAPPVDLSADDASGDAPHPRTGKKNDKKKFFCQVEGCPEKGKPFTYSGMGRHKKSHQPDYRNNVCPGGCGKKFVGRRDVIRRHLRERCPGDWNAGLARLAAEKRGGGR